MAQCVHEQIGVLPTIETERHLVQVGLKMLRADFVPRSYDAALQQRKRRFRCVRVNVSVSIDVIFVPDRLVLATVDSGFDHCLRIGTILIGDDHFNVGAHILFDVLRQSAGANVLRVKEPQIAAALPDSEYDLFVAASPSLTFAMRDSADVGLVHFDGARKQRALHFFHRGANAMAQIPCGLIAPADDSLDLIRAHPFARFTKQICRNKPLREGKVRVLKNRARDHRELMLAGVAFVAVVGFQPRMPFVSAAWAAYAFGPAEPLKNFAASVVRSKHFVQFYNCHRSTSDGERQERAAKASADAHASGKREKRYSEDRSAIDSA